MVADNASNALKIEDIKTVLILGCGTLGLRVGLQAALSGYQVKMYDIHEAAQQKAQHIQGKVLNYLQRHDAITEEEGNAAVARILWTTDAAKAAEGVDFVNESVTEELGLKRKVWEQFGGLCPEHTLFTTNTSYLLPSQLADASGRPERFCAFHFHDVFTAKVVDIMPHPGTAAWVVPLLKTLGARLQQIPVVLEKENTGYLFNFMLNAILGSAAQLLIKGIGSVEDIDRSWMGNFGMPHGPFGLMDEIGLDTVWHVSVNAKDPKSQQFANYIKEYVDAGKLGVKTGEGFYTYPNPRYRDPDFLRVFN